MTEYYFETDNSSGKCKSSQPDEHIIKKMKETFGTALMCVYKESDSKDGMPFIMLYERSSR